MKKKLFFTLSFLCLMVQGTWADARIETEAQLAHAIEIGETHVISLENDIELNNQLVVDGVTVTINLNGHKLSRVIISENEAGHVFYAKGNCNLTLKNTADGSSSIERGNAFQGGAIYIESGSTVSAENIIFQNNSARNYGGAIYNNGTFTAKNCTFTNNNVAKYGAGIWNGGTLNMQGKITVTGNTKAFNAPSNVYLKDGTVITVTGALTGSSIGMELYVGTFTSGYNTYNSGIAPNTIFTNEAPDVVNLGLDDSGEACLTTKVSTIAYIERSWDDTNKQVLSKEKNLLFPISYEDIPMDWQYKEVTNAPADAPNQWFGMGGYSPSAPEYYVVSGEVNRETVVVQGRDVHLILCDGATLTLTGGLKLEGDNKLYIHSQSYGDNMGRLIVTNKYDSAAGIGSARDDGADKTVGELVIYGGHIEATGGEYGAGIGSCSESGNKQLCNKVTVYGGHIEATGGEHAAGIGGGARAHGGDFILYDGTVIAIGGGGTIKIVKGNAAAALLGSYLNAGGGAGVGGGGITNPKFNPYAGYGGNVTIYGGTLTATGQSAGAGIGSGGSFFGDSHQNQRCGGTFTMYGGTVTAAGGGSEAGAAAGIGGGYQNGGGTVYVSGGTVTATGGEGAAGIGGGYSAMGSEVTITGGTVIATTSVKEHYSNRAIGPGQGSDNFGTLSIGDAMMVGAGNDGSVERIMDADERVNACRFRSYAEVSPCTHPSGVTYTINEDGTHNTHCRHCTASEKVAHFNSDGTGTCVCGYKDGGVYYTITVATSSNGTYYEGVGVMAKVGKDMPFILPVCSSIPEGYDFAGWAVNPVHHNGILPTVYETLLQAGENITVNAPISIFARYKPLAIILADDSDNAETLYTYNGKNNASVTLEGRTLTKDGTWNTLCLPFSLDSFAGTPLEGATVKTLASAAFEDGTLTLNFEDASEMVAGKPYIVKWEAETSGDVENPVFEGVTINNTPNPVETDAVTFQGIYAPYTIGGAYKGMLYLDTDNKLNYPNAEMTINAFRAYFQLASAVDDSGDVNGDGKVNVTDVTMMVDYILGKENASFVLGNADMNGDGAVNVTDVTMLVNVILGNESLTPHNVVVKGADGITIDN